MKDNKYIFGILLILAAIGTSSCKNNRVNQFEHLNANKVRKVADEEMNKVSTDSLPAAKEINQKSIDSGFVSVTRVIDGDTFAIFNIYGSEEKIRLIGVNAPESRNSGKKKKEAFGEESKKYLTELLKNKRVKLEFDVQRIDKYGRTLAYVYLENGIFLNEYLVKSGYCQVATFPPNVKYQDLFIDAERFARSNNKGLWK